MRAARVALAAWLIGLQGCSWVLPRPSEPAPDPGLVQCPLDVSDFRKERPQTMQASGKAALLIIRMSSSQEADRTIKSGQSVYFVATHHDASRAVPYLKSGLPSPDSVWQVEAVDSNGSPLGADAPLFDTSAVQLRKPGSGYLSFASGTQGLSDRQHAESLRLFKSDVLDSTRPSTCDAQLRDGDFVFLVTVAQKSWIGVSDTGEFIAGHGDERSNHCPQEERCRTDTGGGLVCAWTPFCSN